MWHSTQHEAPATIVLNFSQLNRTVHEAIKTKRVGVPVFVRYMVGVGKGEADRLDILWALACTVQSWIDDSIHQIYAVESSNQQGTTLSLLFRGGATALVGTMTAAPATPTADVIVLGNHGAIYHEGLATTMLSVGGQGSTHPKLSHELRQAIENALRSRKPQQVVEEEQE